MAAVSLGAQHKARMYLYPVDGINELSTRPVGAGASGVHEGQPGGATSDCTLFMLYQRI